MPKRTSSKKPKRDFTQVAFDVVAKLTGQTPKDKKPDGGIGAALEDKELRKALMREMGKRGGQKGGKARAKKLTPEQRSTIASYAAKSRWRNQQD